MKMKAHFHQEFVCMWSSCEHMFDMRSFILTTKLSCGLFSSSFISTCNSWTLCRLVWYTRSLKYP